MNHFFWVDTMRRAANFYYALQKFFAMVGDSFMIFSGYYAQRECGLNIANIRRQLENIAPIALIHIADISHNGLKFCLRYLAKMPQ